MDGFWITCSCRTTLSFLLLSFLVYCRTQSTDGDLAPNHISKQSEKITYVASTVLNIEKAWNAHQLPHLRYCYFLPRIDLQVISMLTTIIWVVLYPASSVYVRSVPCNLHSSRVFVYVFVFAYTYYLLHAVCSRYDSKHVLLRSFTQQPPRRVAFWHWYVRSEAFSFRQQPIFWFHSKQLSSHGKYALHAAYSERQQAYGNFSARTLAQRFSAPVLE